MPGNETASIKIDADKISEVGKVLIEKVSDAIGGIAKPFQIKRVARAEAEAEMVRAKARIKIGALERRALGRFLSEETKKQTNMEAVIQKALPQVSDTAKPKDMDDDWVMNFFDKCRLVSDEEMQVLWSKVLAGEANSPGKFSKRTVMFLGGIDRKEAEWFRTLCGFGWQLGPFVPLVYDINDRIYLDQGLNFMVLTHLDNIGLGSFAAVAGYTRQHIPKRALAIHHASVVALEFQRDSDNTLNIGKVLLPQVGQELAPLCGSAPVPGFIDYVISRWIQDGVVCSSPYPRVAA